MIPEAKLERVLDRYHAIEAQLSSGAMTNFARLSKEHAQLAPVVEQVFDLPFMTRISVGPGWETFSPAQQEASILNVVVTALLGLSVKLPAADPVIVYLPPTPLTSALPILSAQ